MARANKTAEKTEEKPSKAPSAETVSLAKKIAREMLAERELEQPAVYAYPELENENVQVIRFGKGSLAEATYLKLAAEDKLPLFIPEEFGGKQLRGVPRQRYQLNELILWIRKGVMAEVPATVHHDIFESMENTAKALNPVVQDGDGRWVPADLSKKPSAAEFSR